VLDYQSATSVTVVAVGGDKLSRGLTLEGLSVSYYLRASKNYDTLLQMGRWFGYRPGYLDVTRLYTTPELIQFYVHITRANRELMDLTTAVAKAGQTPRDVGMRVLDGNENLQVTAAAKMRSSAQLSISLAGQRAETLVMLKDKRAAARNHDRLKQLIERILPHPKVPADRLGEAGRGLFREEVPTDVILEFLEGFDVSPRVLTANPENVSDYIRAQTAQDELCRWTVAVTGGNSATRLPIPGEDSLPLVKRAVITGHSRVQANECEVGVLTSPSHETLGLPRGKAQNAYERTIEEFLARGKDTAPNRASGENLRKERDPIDGGVLLVYPIDPAASRIDSESPEIPIVGYTLIFPPSDKARPIRYRVNEVYLQELSRAVQNLDEDDEDRD
jgi:Z1 domain